MARPSTLTSGTSHLPARIQVSNVVVCIDGDPGTPWLRTGRRFTVEAIDFRPGTEDWYLKLVGFPSTWLRDRFVREEDAPAWAGEPADEAVSDEVEHPSHYQLANGRETIEMVEQLDFLRGNAVKYLFRAGKKDGVDELTDLRKAAWYANRAVENLQRERTERA